MNINQFRKDLFQTSHEDFDSKAIELFRFQVTHNNVYKRFVEHLGIDANSIHKVTEIPFLPIELFKGHRIQSGNWKEEATFTSSGTTGSQTSSHLISSLSFYRNNTVEIFKQFYPDLDSLAILALLPSYLERSGSGLITMSDHFIKMSDNEASGFYLYDHDKLYEQLSRLKQLKQPTLLLGVTFALLDFAEKYQVDFPELIVMETGGMKGRKREETRGVVHDKLSQAFNKLHIHSEYGMTELQSQAYSKKNGLFSTPPWMKVLIRESDDPLSLAAEGKSGGINVIDLANTDTCAYIATQDLGKLHHDQFEVLGRFDHADTRGCNLMVS